MYVYDVHIILFVMLRRTLSEKNSKPSSSGGDPGSFLLPQANQKDTPVLFLF